MGRQPPPPPTKFFVFAYVCVPVEVILGISQFYLSVHTPSRLLLSATFSSLRIQFPLCKNFFSFFEMLQAPTGLGFLSCKIQEIGYMILSEQGRVFLLDVAAGITNLLQNFDLIDLGTWSLF